MTFRWRLNKIADAEWWLENICSTDIQRQDNNYLVVCSLLQARTKNLSKASLGCMMEECEEAPRKRDRRSIPSLRLLRLRSRRLLQSTKRATSLIRRIKIFSSEKYCRRDTHCFQSWNAFPSFVYFRTRPTQLLLGWGWVASRRTVRKRETLAAMERLFGAALDSGGQWGK